MRVNLPPFTRILLLTVLLLSALNAGLRTQKWNAFAQKSTLAQMSYDYLTSPVWAVPYLVLVPGQSLKFPWTLMTAALIENNVLSLGTSATAVWFGGRYLERSWGTSEFVKFVVFGSVIPNLGAFLVYAVWFTMRKWPEHPTPIQGLIALEAGFLVALKQLVPEHTVSLFKGSIRVRVKHFPAIFTLANIISGPLLGTHTAMWLSLFGFLISWVYLRFFRIMVIESATTGEGTTFKGDASDTFSFVAFFPDVMHPFLSPICDSIYNVLLQLRICTPFSDEAVEAGTQSGRSATLPLRETGRQAEAERRRALALKALDQRLNKLTAVSAEGQSLPGLAVAE
ncbi:DUF1751-domain-containing protein [Piedraia hortae CBS 480.64]|uniref:DUF1751-domain-containing protein n=1 Tax=Piedraia hortae CBS 480.64 TaxID=1314780 RepID=A0A6A7C779_9PEZI|nr:DUF1751-domain-containing protein [Piedraia hortae CBS 480.64]